VGLVVDVEEEGTVTEAVLATGVEAASAVEVVEASEAAMTLDRREVEVVIGAEAAVWGTKVEVSMMVRLQAGSEVPLGQVDQVGMVLPAGVRVSALPAEAAEALVVTVVTEDISNERAQEVSTTGTQSDHDTRCLAIAPDQLICNFMGGMIAFSLLSLCPFLLCCQCVSLSAS